MTTASEHASFYARAVNCFIDLPKWPTSSRTAVAAALALAFHLLAVPFAIFQLRSIPHIVDVPLMSRFLVVWTLALLFIFVVSLLAVWAGTEGRWTVYLLIAIYGLGIGRLVSLTGTVSTPLVAFFSMAVALVGLFFDARAGFVAFLYAAVVMFAFGTLEILGILPYGEAMRARSVDALRDPRWYALMLIVIEANFVYAFILMRLSVAARDAQQQRLAEAHARLADSSDQLGRANDIISRYVASQLAQQIMAGNYDAVDHHARRKLTLFFSDIKDFAETADHVEPEDLSEILNEYLSEMATIGERYGGTIDKFVGDAIMIFFGAPLATSDRDHALRAVHMAIDMQERMVTLGEKWRRDGFERPFQIRIGINTGQASVGNFGSRGRMDYTAMGRQVNLAARLQAHCEPQKILLSHSTWVLVQDEVECVDKGEIHVKGSQNPVNVYEVRRRTAQSPHGLVRDRGAVARIGS